MTTPNRYPRTLTLDEIERIAHAEGDMTTLDLLERFREALEAEYDSAFGEDDPS